MVHSHESNLKEALIEVAQNNQHSHGQIHALWTLQGMDLLDLETLLSIAEQPNTDENLRNHVLLLSKNFLEEAEEFRDFYEQVFEANQAESNYLLAHIAGQNSNLEAFWWKLAQQSFQDSVLVEALVSGIAGKENYFLQKLEKTRTAFPNYLGRILGETIANQQRNLLQSPQLSTTASHDDRTNGLRIFKNYCASCHGMDGRGQKKVAPSLADSDIVKGKDTRIAEIILHGYQPPSENYQMPMPAYLNDSNLSNQDILDIVSYLKSTFTVHWSSLKESQVDSLRRIKQNN